MKKVLCMLLVLAVILTLDCLVMAQDDEYSLTIDYNGNAFKNVPIQTNVNLIGKDATPYSNVRVKVDVSGPATPIVKATDSAGTEYDIGQLGYWGPESGFAVGGTFTNTTPVTVTFPEAGLYEMVISLVNVQDSSIITQANGSVYVYEDEDELNAANNQINNDIIDMNNTTGMENAILELPKTGRSFGDYASLIAILFIITACGYWVIKKNK